MFMLKLSPSVVRGMNDVVTAERGGDQRVVEGPAVAPLILPAGVV